MVCEMVRDGARGIGLIGATYADVRDVMIAGESGLLSMARGSALYEPSKRAVAFANGAVAHVFTAEEADGLRGYPLEAAWVDGKKTYIVAFVAAVTAILQSLGYTIPEWAYPMAAALGIGALRVAITKSQQ
jgi:phage terminase large subunit-like protein